LLKKGAKGRYFILFYFILFYFILFHFILDLTGRELRVL